MVFVVMVGCEMDIFFVFCFGVGFMEGEWLFVWMGK